MDWQQPDQRETALPSYPYISFYQQDSNQPSYNYDEDNEEWDDDDEENEGYQNQNAYYYNEPQKVDMTTHNGHLGGAVSSHTAELS